MTAPALQSEHVKYASKCTCGTCRRCLARARKAGSPCTCGTCKSCRLRAAYARGTRTHYLCWHRWTPAQEQWLQAHAGEAPVSDLAEQFAARFHLRRTVAALKHRIGLLGVSRKLKSLSMHDLTRVFGVNQPTILRWWVDTGLLPGAQGTFRRGPWPMWLFQPADVERFIREYSYAYDWRMMAPGRYRSLAELIARREGWLSCKEAVRLIGIAQSTLNQWCREGRLPCKRWYGAGGAGSWRIHRADAVAARELKRERAPKSGRKVA